MTGTVLITGAAGGIGQELTRLFAADGYRVLGFDLRGDALEALGKDLPDGCDYRPVAMDLSEPDAAVRVADWLDRHAFAGTWAPGINMRLLGITDLRVRNRNSAL